ncbi:MAG: DUF2058 family protein [Bradymonadales bacterium]|nr:DUF2058 family protein [Bradymonadales bacterium]
MKNLRDAMLKAGVVSEKQKRRAEHAKRVEEKARQKGEGAQPPAPPSLSTAGAGVTGQGPPEQRGEGSKSQKVTDLILGGRLDLDLGGRRRFNFVARDGIIPFLAVSESLGLKLERGQAAIVEDPVHAGDHTLVNREVALRLMELDPDRVRFFRQ